MFEKFSSRTLSVTFFCYTYPEMRDYERLVMTWDEQEVGLNLLEWLGEGSFAKVRKAKVEPKIHPRAPGLRCTEDGKETQRGRSRAGKLE